MISLPFAVAIDNLSWSLIVTSVTEAFEFNIELLVGPVQTEFMTGANCSREQGLYIQMTWPEWVSDVQILADSLELASIVVVPTRPESVL